MYECEGDKAPAPRIFSGNKNLSDADLILLFSLLYITDAQQLFFCIYSPIYSIYTVCLVASSFFRQPEGDRGKKGFIQKKRESLFI